MPTSRKTDAVDKIIGTNIGRFRKLAGVSQVALGAALTPPMSSQQISKYELGVNRITVTHLLGVAKALDRPIADLIDGVGDCIQASGGFAEIITRGDGNMIRQYRQIRNPELQGVVRMLVNALVKECAGKISTPNAL